MAVVIFKRTDWFPWIGECNWRGYDREYFMAYCHTRRYGDYEHWAYWNGAEPEILEGLKQADVLFLGNSRTQFAFSTEAVSDFFRDYPSKHYVFGFGVGSQSEVPLRMIERHKLKPKVLVINADPFFSDYFSDVNVRMTKNDRSTSWGFDARKWLQKEQRKICVGNKTSNGIVKKAFCSGESETLYRNRKNGHWRTDFFRENKMIPVSYDDKLLLDRLDKTVEYAQNFIKRTGIDRSCVIITVTPRTDTPLQFARRLADKLQVPSAFPSIDGLITIDGSHLDKVSAERWSREFLRLAKPVIDRCAVRGGKLDSASSHHHYQ